MDSSVIRIRRIVVLPEPEGPIRASFSPWATSKLSAFSTWLAPKLFDTLSIRIMGDVKTPAPSGSPPPLPPETGTVTIACQSQICLRDTVASPIRHAVRDQAPSEAGCARASLCHRIDARERPGCPSPGRPCKSRGVAHRAVRTTGPASPSPNGTGRARRLSEHSLVLDSGRPTSQTQGLETGIQRELASQGSQQPNSR